MFELSINHSTENFKNMEQEIINQEILLFTGTCFCSRPLCKRNTDHDNSDIYSCMEELEKACWDGMLLEMLPELFEKPVQRSNNYVWSTVSGVNFLCINMGSNPLLVEKETSIDPYYFLYKAVNSN